MPSSWDHSKYGECPVIGRQTGRPCQRTPINARIRNGVASSIDPFRPESEKKFCRGHVGLAVLIDDDIAAKVDAEWLADLCDLWEVRDGIVVPK